MKFRSIYLILIILIINYVKCEHLTEEENLNRLENCGNQSLPTPKVIKDNYKMGLEIEHSTKYWIVKVHTKKDGVTKSYPTTGFFISPRHILTSAESVIDENMKWGFDGEQLKMETIDDSNNAVVPEGGIAAMEVVLGDCGELCIVKPKTAVVVNIKHRNDFNSMFSIMIIELKNDVQTVQFPCIADESVNVEQDDDVHSYAFCDPNPKNQTSRLKLLHHFADIVSVMENDKWICIYSYVSKHDRGGPLVKTVNDKQMVIGLGSNSVPKNGQYKYFFDLRAYGNEICSLSGVCPVKQLTSTTTTTTISTSTITEQSIDSFSSSTTISRTIPSTIQELITTQERKRTRKPIKSSNRTMDNGEDDEFNIREYDEDSNEFYLSKKPIRKLGRILFFWKLILCVLTVLLFK